VTSADDVDAISAGTTDVDVSTLVPWRLESPRLEGASEGGRDEASATNEDARGVAGELGATAENEAPAVVVGTLVLRALSVSLFMFSLSVFCRDSLFSRMKRKSVADDGEAGGDGGGEGVTRRGREEGEDGGGRRAEVSVPADE